MDFRLHFFTQHSLKHKGIAKFLCLEKEQKIDHIIRETFLKCQPHSQLYSVKNKEILTVILSLLLKKLIWNQRKGAVWNSWGSAPELDYKILNYHKISQIPSLLVFQIKEKELTALLYWYKDVLGPKSQRNKYM